MSLQTLLDGFTYIMVGGVIVSGPVAAIYYMGNLIDDEASTSDKWGLGFSFFLVLGMALGLFYFVGRWAVS